MRKLVSFICVLFLSATVAFAAPTYAGGSDGYITMPSVYAPYGGRLGLSIKYMGTKQNIITPAFNFAPFTRSGKRLEVGASWDIVLAEDYLAPIMPSIKFRFSRNAAIGAWMQIPLKDTDSIALTSYLAWEAGYSIGSMGAGRATVAIGYTFHENSGADINFHTGFRQRAWIDQLYIVLDFANYSYKYTGTVSKGLDNQKDARGILNFGLQALLTDWITLEFTGVDLMDDSRGLYFGASFYFVRG